MVVARFRRIGINARLDEHVAVVVQPPVVVVAAPPRITAVRRRCPRLTSGPRWRQGLSPQPCLSRPSAPVWGVRSIAAPVCLGGDVFSRSARSREDLDSAQVEAALAVDVHRESGLRRRSGDHLRCLGLPRVQMTVVPTGTTGPGRGPAALGVTRTAAAVVSGSASSIARAAWRTPRRRRGAARPLAGAGQSRGARHHSGG